jgi:hypothetical protein
MKRRRNRTTLIAVTAAVGLALLDATAANAQHAMRTESGVLADGMASDQWLAMLRKRLDDTDYGRVVGVRRQLTAADQAWAHLIRSRVTLWEGETSTVARPYRPVRGPDTVVIVLGNRGASDAFTHDATTIGFDLAALHEAYGDATQPANLDRIDRLFRHEYAHLMQKAWMARTPFDPVGPIDSALLDIWLEGLGNYLSMSRDWRALAGHPSARASETLRRLEPRFVARVAALTCAAPGTADPLMADLSSGSFTAKWGALPAALWLEAEASVDPDALRAFVVAGPTGVWDLAQRHLGEDAVEILREARQAALLCHVAEPGPQSPGPSSP